jgi:hypothetical protein
MTTWTDRLGNTGFSLFVALVWKMWGRPSFFVACLPRFSGTSTGSSRCNLGPSL